MITLPSMGELIAVRRKELGLSQAVLAGQAKVGHSTLDALENGRMGELGFSKVARILSVLGLALRVEPTAAHRPTLDELMEEGRDETRGGGRPSQARTTLERIADALEVTGVELRAYIKDNPQFEEIGGRMLEEWKSGAAHSLKRT